MSANRPVARCHDWSAGHKSRYTISNLGTWRIPWGRKDVMVYIVAVAVFALMIVTRREVAFVVRQVAPSNLAGIFTVVALLGVPIIAAAIVDKTNLEFSDLSRHIVQLGAVGQAALRLDDRARTRHHNTSITGLAGRSSTTWHMPPHQPLHEPTEV